MFDPRFTGYGWLVKMPDGSLIEFATIKEAEEAYTDATSRADS